MIHKGKKKWVSRGVDTIQGMRERGEYHKSPSAGRKGEKLYEREERGKCLSGEEGFPVARKMPLTFKKEKGRHEDGGEAPVVLPV